MANWAKIVIIIIIIKKKQRNLKINSWNDDSFVIVVGVNDQAKTKI